MTAPLRAGLVGLGMMGRHHARVLRSLDGVELVAVVDPAGDVHGAAGAVPVVADLEALLALGVDCCVVAVPTEDHEAVALHLAGAGVHTLVEKPVATTVEAGRRLVRAFADAGLVAGVGHIERGNAAIRSMKERIAGGDVGAVFQIATSRQGPFPDRIRDVGVVKDLATHDIDLTAWVAGSRYVSVSARVAHRAGRPHEDLVAAVGLLADGTVTNHLVNWLTPTKERRVVVTGERGCLVADMLSADLTFFANASVPTEWDDISRFRGVSEGDMIRYAIAKPEPLRVELEQFVAAVRGEPSQLVTLLEGLEALEVADAMVVAAAEGRTVAIGEAAP